MGRKVIKVMWAFVFVFLSSNCHAQISRHEFKLEPNTPCVLGGDFEKITQSSIKPGLLIYLCTGNNCSKIELLTKTIESSFNEGQLLLVFAPAIKNDNIDVLVRNIVGYVCGKYAVDNHKIFTISSFNLDVEDRCDSERISKPAAGDKDSPNIILTPGIGCLPVKYGMTQDQIVAILGKPDQFIGEHCMDYSSTIGLSLLVHSKRGLLAIDCWGKDEKSTEGHYCGKDFIGKFSQGIGIGSTQEELEKIFGKSVDTSSVGGTKVLIYQDINTAFTLQEGKISHISMDNP